MAASGGERFDFYPAPLRGRPGTSSSPATISRYRASLVKTAEYRYPVYREPDDSRTRRARGKRAPGYSRHDIDVLGKLEGKGYEIAWLRDPVDRFFLHIQGSGLLRMTDGREVPLNFAASNGRRYTSIGKISSTGRVGPGVACPYAADPRWLAEFPDQREGLFARTRAV